MSIVNDVLEVVLQLINSLGLFKPAILGPLTPEPGIAVMLGPSNPETVYMSKDAYLYLDITLNGRHSNLWLLTGDMNRIHSGLTRAKKYAEGQGWEIVDITTQTLPQVIDREPNNDWLMASSLIVKVYQTAE